MTQCKLPITGKLYRAKSDFKRFLQENPMYSAQFRKDSLNLVTNSYYSSSTNLIYVCFLLGIKERKFVFPANDKMNGAPTFYELFEAEGK